ncbi:hypothetical protein THRCLA_08587 [Thraustotheca clavata]|uniref:DFDF domain-containing protein n=1 Tax=Thraustotheca clavata TaxID=74557 RepID=A0A1V9Z4Q3_9STRA|nr:hypothetical protein THRCLA_08587 [Thraustotheca clavata]
MSEPKSEGIPYIGSRISLISKTDIRYEGLLFNIDTRQSMVALQNVRSFGTEGRRPDHIPPSDTVLQYATFKASEIKDLHVCEAAAPMPPPPPMQYQPPPPMPRQPPVPESQPPLPPAPRAVSPKAAPASSTLLTPGAMSNAQQAVPKPLPVQQQSPASAVPELANVEPKQVQVNSTPSPRQPIRHEAESHRTIPGMGGHLLKRKERRIGGDTSMTESELAADFDFSVGLHDFNKEQEYNKMSMDNADAVRPVLKGSYQKSSFFDTISCDALDRLEGVNGRMRAHEERKLNTETFGAVGLNNRRSYRGGRSGGRGNNRNRNNNNSNSGNSSQTHNVFPNNRNGNGGRGQQRHYNNSGRGQQRQQVYQPRDQA